MYLQASYIIDEVKDFLNGKLKKPIESLVESRFSSYKLESIEINPDVWTPIHKVIFNYFSRGIPTRCTLKIEEYLLEKFGNYTIHDTNLDEVIGQLFNDQTIDSYLDSYDLLKIIEYPIQVARIHKALAAFLPEANEKEILVFFDLLDLEFSELIVEEFNDHIKAFYDLCPDMPCDIFRLVENREKAHLDLSLIEHVAMQKPPTFKYGQAVLYKDYGRQVEDIDESQKVFSRFKVHEKEMHKSLLFLLMQTFRFDSFNPGQQEILRRILLRQDVIGLLPTGGGKSLCYQFGGLLQPGLMVVVDPINSLMKDQELKLHQHGINRSAFINSMLQHDERDKRLERIAQAYYLFLFISPERFHIAKYRSKLEAAKQQGTAFHYVVIDEAHVVSEWGHDFRPSYLKLANSISTVLGHSPELRPAFIGLTATASFDVLADIQRELTLDDQAQLTSDIIATLPPDAINRKELNFHIIPMNYWKEGMESMPFFKREFGIAPVKLNSLLHALDTTDRQYQVTTLKENGVFKNGSIIFCPTKSDRLPSGVISIKEELTSQLNWQIVSFMGQGSGVVFVKKKILEEAKKSEHNQDLFLSSKVNLMVCTKAFGMGIDKPNVRSTIHYSMPPSVEAFYQEAGRAGRDRQKANCYMLYDYHDVQTNIDFLNNSFKNREKEITISDELCHRIKFEKGFKRKRLSHLISKEASLSVNVSPSKNGDYLNLWGEFRKEWDDKILYGSIKISSQTFSDKYARNVTTEEKEVVKIGFDKVISSVLGEEFESLKSWFGANTARGLIPRMQDLAVGDIGRMIVGFRNDEISELAQFLEGEHELGYNGEASWATLNWERLLHRSYEFASDGEEFYERLVHYSITLKAKSIVIAHHERITQAYYHIRSTNDTERAIFRLKQLGVVEDYLVDYSSLHFEITFTSLDLEKYRRNLTNYYRRYIAINKANQLTDKARDLIGDENFFIPYRDSLIDFVHGEIKEKRRKSIMYMYELCEKFQEHSEEEFKTDIKYYFASKYSASLFLPKDSKNGTYSSPALVQKYLRFIYDPPNGLGGPINNFEHLKGACNRYLISQGTIVNSSILILNSTCTLAVESSRTQDLDQYLASERFERAKNQFLEGYIKIIEDANSLRDLKELMKENIALLAEFNPNLQDELKEIEKRISIMLLIKRASKARQRLN